MLETAISNEFDDIRPYTDGEMPGVLKRICDNPWLSSGIMKMRFPKCPKFLSPIVTRLIRRQLWGRLRKLETIDEFQREIIVGLVIAYIEKKTTDGVTASGTEMLSKGVPYLFISNHRDIVLDSAFINQTLVHSGLDTAENAIGDNLLVNDFVTDLIRINRSFIVKRNLPLRELAKAALTLSRYIRFTMSQGNSVWIAQRVGRAKDGNDRTTSSVIKMLHYAPRREGIRLSAFVNSINIVPVAVSYEKDPCDVLKARELYRRLTKGTYKKRKDEDLLSMYAGLKGKKGRVHVAYGNPVRGNFTSVQEVAEAIDNEIHRVYKLWPTNYIAYDLLNGGSLYSKQYSKDDVKSFSRRFRKEKAQVRSLALEMYANAVINQYQSNQDENVS